MELICPQCHSIVRPTDFFCFNCGKNLKPAPLPTGVEAQLMLYIKSLILPPMGIFWGLGYLRQPDRKSKIVGVVAMALTVMVIWVVVRETMTIINTVNKQVDSQLNGLGGF